MGLELHSVFDQDYFGVQVIENVFFFSISASATPNKELRLINTYGLEQLVYYIRRYTPNVISSDYFMRFYYVGYDLSQSCVQIIEKVYLSSLYPTPRPNEGIET